MFLEYFILRPYDEKGHNRLTFRYPQKKMTEKKEHQISKCFNEMVQLSYIFGGYFSL